MQSTGLLITALIGIACLAYSTYLEQKRIQIGFESAFSFTLFLTGLVLILTSIGVEY